MFAGISKLKLFAGIGCALAALAFLTIPQIINYRAYTTWKRERAEWDVNTKRWYALIEVGRCLRSYDRAGWWVPALTQVAPEQRRQQTQMRFEQSGSPDARPGCVTQLAPLHEGLATTPAAIAALDELVAADAKWTAAFFALADYYAVHTPHEDHFAGEPGLWDRVVATRAALSESVAKATKLALPATREAIAAVATTRETSIGRDAMWWQISAALRVEDLSADVEAARQAQMPLADQRKLAQRDVRALYDAMKPAPPALVHLIHADETLDALATGQRGDPADALESNVETYTLWTAQPLGGGTPYGEPPEEAAGCHSPD